VDTNISPLRRTTIVATLEPVTSDPDTIKPLAEAGMSVARINLWQFMTGALIRFTDRGKCGLQRYRGT